MKVHKRRLALRAAVGVAVAVAVPAVASAHERYVVRLGDTLSGIAARHGLGLDRLARDNGIDPDDVLPAGRVLLVPSSGHGATAASGGSYVVRPGDTLTAIATRAGVRTETLARANGMHLEDTLFAGASLRLPSAMFAASTGGPAPATVPAGIDFWAAHYGVDARLVRALAWQESGFQHRVVSSAGALGVMQVMPDTWEFVEQVLIGHAVPHTADGNIRVGVAFLHHLLREFGDERLALAAYYQGAGSVRQRGPIPETEAYVRNVLALRSRM